MTISRRWLIAGVPLLAAALLAIWMVLAAALLTVWSALSPRTPEPASPTIHAYLLPARPHGAVAPWVHKPTAPSAPVILLP